jgi:hypothetical protein
VIVYVMNWDLPPQKANLEVYTNKARNDWIPFTLNHSGVTSLRSYRNILETTPQVAVVIEFEHLDSWKEYIGSKNYMRLMRELRILGCQHISTRVWSLWEMGGSPPLR